MVEQQNMKVYELAKELGLTPLGLLDKLNGLNIKVKSHMSDLGPQEVQTARSSLGKKTAEPAAKKAPVRKKKAAAPAATAAAAVPAPAPVEPIAAGKAAATIIRRRTKADGTTETAASGPIGGIARPSESDAAEVSYHDQEAEAQESGEEPAPEYVEAAAEEAAPEAVVEEPAPEAVVEAQASSPEAAAVSPEAPVASVAAAAPGAAPGVTPVAGAKPARAPVTLPPRPVAPRRSILKIVEHTAPLRPNVVKAAPPAPVIKPAVKGVATQDKDGFRIIKMTKENLDAMVEEEAAKKRGGGREAEIRPEDVRFADYRKKEMVFLPKRKKLPVGKELKRTQKTTPKAIKRVVQMQETITVHELAEQMGVKANDVVRKLMGLGQMGGINSSVDFDTATLVAHEYQHEVKSVAFKEADLLITTEDTEAQLKWRPPVVTIMGHVDHGKTSLLDAIRSANVASGEAGGITQHIGAYTVYPEGSGTNAHGGRAITFIDTPGHEAFTVMRARGANVTDLVILVVAADDGVMPQTREALSHAQAAGVPIIVAMNKIDKASANPEKIKQQLSELNLLAEDWGGQTMFIPVSAVKKTNLDKLLEAVLLQAEVLDLKANAEARATGVVLEARLEKGRGPMVSLLVKRGTLKIGDSVISGTIVGKVKALLDDKGAKVKEVAPGMAAEVLGFEGVPNAGEKFDAAENESEAREIAQNRIDKNRARTASPGASKASLDDLFSKIASGAAKELNVVLKADVYGSVEAIRDSLGKIGTDKVKVKVIAAAPGGVTESDVMLASASEAIVLGFNVRPETKARQLAEAEHVEIKCYTIIYELLDDIKKSMAGLLDKKKVEKFLGRAEVRQTFSVPKVGTIAGTSVIDGKIIRGANVRLLRDSRIIFEGKMSSLKRFKDDAKEVATGFECGIGLENFNDLKAGDVIEAYQIELITPELGA